MVILFSFPLSYGLSSTERVLSANPNVVNILGVDVDYITIDNQIQITGDVTNVQNIEQPFIFIMQIRDQKDSVIHLSWVGGALFPLQTLSPAISWVPLNSGEYIIQIFVWDSLINADPLSPILEHRIIVH